jgi:hypothetical protein
MKQGSRDSPDVRSVEVVSSADEQVPMSPRARALRPVAPVERILYTREEAATALAITFERRVQPFIRPPIAGSPSTADANGPRLLFERIGGSDELWGLWLPIT